MNTYTPARYDERVFHLALGVEPRDATSQQRLLSSVDVRVEEFPTPVDTWRRWAPGETLTEALPRLHRHRSGRFVRRYEQQRTSQSVLRIVDDRLVGRSRVVGAGRSIVPRRLRVTLPALADVVAADADPLLEPVPVWQRSFPFSFFPGASASVPSRSTVLRGRVLRSVDGEDVPVRWARVRAENADGETVGWAHGDDRGEFVLVVEPTPTPMIPVDPLPVAITIGAPASIEVPDPADPLRAEVDPLWDLPIEDVTAVEDAGSEPAINGRRFLPGTVVASPIPNNPVDLPHGRETSREFRIA